ERDREPVGAGFAHHPRQEAVNAVAAEHLEPDHGAQLGVEEDVDRLADVDPADRDRPCQDVADPACVHACPLFAGPAQTTAAAVDAAAAVRPSPTTLAAHRLSVVPI